VGLSCHHSVGVLDLAAGFRSRAKRPGAGVRNNRRHRRVTRSRRRACCRVGRPADLAIAVVGGILLLARSRGEEEEAPPALVDDELEADLLVALNEASTELELTDDPRLSVMNAYATLERVLASHERTRLRSETPTEHVRRSVESLRIDPAPLVQLGELYSLARFSEDEITVDQQDDARMALERARDGLAARS